MNWINEAATELASHFSFGTGRDSYVTEEQRQEVAKGYAQIINKYVPRCDSCRHWEAYPLDMMSQRAGDCNVLIPHRPHKEPLKYATCGDFGCVQWEAK